MNNHLLKGKPILVTGGSGFIGSNLVKKLMEVGAEVYVVGGDGSRGGRRNLEDVGFSIREGINYFNMDLRSQENCRKIIKDMHTVYHLAAKIGGIAYILKHGLDVWKDNTLIDANLFQTVVNNSGVENFIYASTACVYPLKWNKSELPHQNNGWKEADAWTGETHSLYGGSKLIAEKALRMHVQNKNVRAMITRFHNVYGPRSVMKGTGSQVIQALVAKALNNPNQDLEIWGSGNQGRDFIYVTDVADWLTNVFYTKDGKLPQEPVQRGSGVNTTIKEVAQAILDTLNSNVKIVHKPVLDEGEEARIADNSKFEELYPQFPAPLSIKEGINQYIEWALPREAWWKVDDKFVVSFAQTSSSYTPKSTPTMVDKILTVDKSTKEVSVSGNSILLDEYMNQEHHSQVLPRFSTSNEQTSQRLQPVKPIGTYLVEAGLLTAEQVEVALREQKLSRIRFGEVLSKLGWVKQQTIEYMMEKVILPEQQQLYNSIRFS